MNEKNMKSIITNMNEKNMNTDMTYKISTSVNVYKYNKSAIIPTFGTSNSACFDLSACLEDGMTIKKYFHQANSPQSITLNGSKCVSIGPNERLLVPTGIVFDIPENYYMRLYIRSSMAWKKGIFLANSVGIIDQDYVDPVYVMLYNSSKISLTINHGDRIAQLEVVKQIPIELSETKIKPAIKTDRSGGIGSTG